jgi:SOS-response transcriptional repressor LexA
VVTPEGEWTIKHVKQSGHLVILYPANPATDDTFPPLIDRKLIHAPIVGRVVWVRQSLA